MSTTRVQDLTNIGDIQESDKLVGERVDGTTVRITFNGVLYDSRFSTNGFITRTASGTYENRTITGTAGTITVTNGDGVSGNPTLTIDSSYIGQNTITTLGTVTTGVWNGSAVGLTYGGTGTSLTASNGGIVYSTGTTLGILDGTATAGKVLMSGSNDSPSWSDPTFPNSASVARTIILADGTNWVSSTETYAAPGSAGNLMRSDGTNWTAAKATLTTDVSGILPVANGGSGVSSNVAYSVLCGGVTSTDPIQSVISVGTSGQVLTSNGAGALPTFQTTGSSITLSKVYGLMTILG